MLSSLEKHRDLGVLALRIALAVIFFYHGQLKWGMWSPDAQMTGGMLVLFKALSIIEPLCAVALLIGIFTRPAALLLLITMVGAIYFKIMVFGVGFAGAQGTGWEFDLILGAACLSLLFGGAGKYSLDAKKSMPAV